MATEITVTTIDAILKVQYPEPKVQQLCYRQQAIFTFLKKARRAVSGKDYSFSVEMYRGDNSRYQAEGATLKNPTAPLYVRPYLNPKTVVTRRFLTQESIDDSGDNLGSLFSTVLQIPKDITRDHSFHVARGAWTGDNGSLATCGTTSATTLIQLSTTANMRRFYRNMKIDVKDANGDDVTNAGSLIVTAVDEDNERLTVGTTSITTTSSHTVHVEDETYDAGSNTIATYVWNGVPALVGTGDIHNTSTTTYPEFKSYVNTATGTLTRGKIQAMVNWVKMRFEGTGYVLYTSPEVVVAYTNILVDDIRYSPADFKKMVGGYPTTMVYSGGTAGYIPIVEDALCPVDEMYLIHPASIRFFTPAFMKWFNLNGSKFQDVSGSLQWECKLYSRGNLAIVNRLGSGKLQAITI